MATAPNGGGPTSLLSAIKIENFRGFRLLEFRKFAQFNVVVGPNASGKTALLEAIFLASANSPEVSIRLRTWRGLGASIEVGPGKGFYEGLWRDLFFEDAREFFVEVEDGVRRKRSCRVHYAPDQALTVPLDSPSYDAAAVVPVEFEWQSNGEKFSSRVEISSTGFRIRNVPEALFPSVFLPSGHKGGTEEAAKRYSDLSKENQEAGVVAALNRIYPLIGSLSVEVDPGGPMLYANVKGLRKKLPLPAVSEGINKYFSILLAIHAAQGGVLLLDEAENGFYRERFTSIVSAVVEESLMQNTQIFLTTHSMEFLQSLLPVLKTHASRFSLIRTKRDDATGACGLEGFEGRKMASAIEEGFEIR